MRWKCNFLVTATVIASIWGHAPKASAQSVESFYRNKNIRFLVGTDVGAGFSALSMLMGQFLSKHIPGNPTITIEHMPGAGGAGNEKKKLSGAPSGLQFPDRYVLMKRSRYGDMRFPSIISL